MALEKYFYQGSPLLISPRKQTAEKILVYISGGMPKMISVLYALRDLVRLNCGGVLGRMREDDNFSKKFPLTDERIEHFLIGYNMMLEVLEYVIYLGVDESMLQMTLSRLDERKNLVPKDLLTMLKGNLIKYARFLKINKVYDQVLSMITDDIVNMRYEFVAVGSVYASRDIIGLHEWIMNQV